MEDLVYKTQREKFNAVIDKIDEIVKQGRPVLVGTTTVEISELLSRMLNMRKIQHNVLNAKHHKREAEIVAEAGQAGKVTIATNMVKIINKIIVNGFKDGEVIQAKMISKSIERAQKKVEENNFGIRKRLLEYDDVMNAQRNAIYKKRKNALFGDRIGLDVSNMFYDVAEEIVNDYYPKKDFNGFEFDLLKYLKIESPVSEEEFKSTNPSQLIDLIFDKATEAYKAKSNRLIEQANPVVQQVYKNEGDRYKNMAFPITDHEKTINVILPLKEASETNAKILKTQIEKSISLGFIDNEWKEHLRRMDDLRTSVQHASIEQKDPLVIYKKEAFDLFTSMLGKMSKEVVGFLTKAELPNQSAENIAKTDVDFEEVEGAFEGGQVSSTPAPEFNGSDGYNEAMQNSNNQRPKQKPIVVEQKIGRNEKVKIRNMQTGEVKDLKFKQAEPLLKSKVWMLIKD
jgi:preprotein translocase subunit SecA